MTIQEQRMMLAKFMEFSPPTIRGKNKQPYFYFKGKGVMPVKCWHPDQSLDQCHECEKRLTGIQWGVYEECLFQIWVEIRSLQDYAYFVIHASAEQKFKALIQTITEKGIK